MLSKEIVVVDYHRGNLQSVVRGLSAVGGLPSRPMTLRELPLPQDLSFQASAPSRMRWAF